MQKSGQAGRSCTVGVLALQGDYAAHEDALRDSGSEVILVRAPHELRDVNGLVIPGGESTAFLKLLSRANMFEAIKRFCTVKPVFGTCAGCILLAKNVLPARQESLAVLDIDVQRNAYGRQTDSRVAVGEYVGSEIPLEMVLIRAPMIVRTGPDVEILARYLGVPTLVRQRNILAATFHPELSTDRRIHRFFYTMVCQSIQRSSS